MDRLDTIKADSIGYALTNNWRKIPFINSINKDYLLYIYKGNKTLFEYLLEYKKYNDFPLSLLNVNWDDTNLLKYVYRYYMYLDEDDLFTKYNTVFKGLRGETSSEKTIFYFLLKNYVLSSDMLKVILNRYPGRYMEAIDILIDANKPEYILLFDNTIINLIKDNQDEVFGKYKDMNIVFVQLAKLMKDKDLISQLCEKYNHKDLLNSIMIDTSNVKFDIDNPIKRNEEIDVSLLSEINQRLIIDFYNAFVNKDNREKLKEVCAFLYDSLKVDNEFARQIIEDIIRIKKIDQDFSITFDDQRGSLFYPYKPPVVNFSSETFAPITIFHEFTHAIHYYNNESAIQHDISNMIQYIQSNPSEYEERYNTFQLKFKEMKEKTKDIANEKIEKAVDESILKHKDDQSWNQHLIEQSIDEEKFFQKMRSILLNEYFYKYYFYHYPHYEALSDIFDAIFKGIPCSFFDTTGHGIDYFSYHQQSISEIIADFMSLKCLPDSEAHMEFLKEHLGEELFDVIEKGCYEVLGYDTLTKDKDI